MKGTKVAISEGGYFYKKVDRTGWFRIFGTQLFTKDAGTGRFQWSLEVERYSNRDISGITFGVVEEDVANRLKTKTTFDYSSDIRCRGFYGIGGDYYYLHNMTKVKNWTVSTGQRYNLVLDLNTGLFKISLNGSVIVKTMSMRGKKVRPSLAIYYGDN